MMVKMVAPVCNFDEPAKPFRLINVDGKRLSLEDCRGKQGTLVMFISNHCPYVKAVLPRLLADAKTLIQEGIGVVAICANDSTDYPEDSFENMKKKAQELAFPFPYLWDETQEVAKAYGAVCTPDFFGYNTDLKLQYRGRLDASGMKPAPAEAKRELVEAMRLIAQTGKGPTNQIPSQGCSIKWRES